MSRPYKKAHVYLSVALNYKLYNISSYCVCGPDLVILGVGYHHAGVDLSDRKIIEEAFTRGDLPVLCENLSLSQFYPVLQTDMRLYEYAT